MRVTCTLLKYHANKFFLVWIAAENTDTVVLPEQADESQSPPQEHEVKVQTEDTTSEEVKNELTEEEIADIMVGHAEVLTGTTIG